MWVGVRGRGREWRGSRVGERKKDNGTKRKIRFKYSSALQDKIRTVIA